MKWLLGGVITLFACILPMSDSVSAQPALRVQPLEYRTSLTVGETKKGYVDITNPGDTRLLVTVSVQAFRQVDDTGVVEFYDNEAVAAGVIPDFTEFDLEPAQAIRLYFLVKGNVLPPGDVFGVLFATGRDPTMAGDINPVIRVGTLLSIENGTPGARDANIVHVDVPFWQFDDQLEGSYVVQNQASAAQATGFYPTVTVSLDPLRAQQQFSSLLVCAGRSRTNEFSFQQSRLGFYTVTVSHGESQQGVWVFMATGPWFERLIVGLIGLIIIVAGLLIWRRKNKQKSTTGELLRKSSN